VTWRTRLMVALHCVVVLAVGVGLAVLCAWVGSFIDAFLTAQLGAFESQATAWVVLLTLLLWRWDVHRTRRNL